jgi:hypothetical protein
MSPCCGKGEIVWKNPIVPMGKLTASSTYGKNSRGNEPESVILVHASKVICISKFASPNSKIFRRQTAIAELRADSQRIRFLIS